MIGRSSGRAPGARRLRTQGRFPLVNVRSSNARAKADQSPAESERGGLATCYHDHPEAGGYFSIALRAPNDTWNGFYDDYVYPLVETTA